MPWTRQSAVNARERAPLAILKRADDQIHRRQHQEEKRESAGLQEDKQSIHEPERGISEVRYKGVWSSADFRRCAASVTVAARLALTEIRRYDRYPQNP